MKKSLFPLVFIFLFISRTNAQIDEDQTGAWYMLFWNTDFGESQWGLQGDYQFRNWDLGGDLEQLLLRTGVTYQNKSKTAKATLGYAYISTGAFGDSDETVGESRIYQELLLPHLISRRVQLTHRFRFEQRWVEEQDFRIRWRYNIFLNIPLNRPVITRGTFYLAFYNEIFINGGRDIGEGREVQLFDRNRTYGALGYGIHQKHRLQLGIMRQTTDNWAKSQLQLSLHSKL